MSATFSVRLNRAEIETVKLKYGVQHEKEIGKKIKEEVVTVE